MNLPCYITITQARSLLADMGVELSERQLKRAAEPDHNGHRRLPFFRDPIDGRLKIEKGTLVRLYRQLQIEAERNTQN
ncbi:MAG: hypothetical protein CTY31_10570 [Hyphomicrobium sp.]|nr:MAG: hypothetical protein CTY31_10570 [Hyphomicrobium sp.]